MNQNHNVFDKAKDTFEDIMNEIIKGAARSLEGIRNKALTSVGQIGGMFDTSFQKRMQMMVTKDNGIDRFVNYIENPNTFVHFSDPNIISSMRNIDQSYINQMSPFGQRIVRGTASGVGGMLPYIAAGQIAGNLGFSPSVREGIAQAVLFASASGQSTEEALHEGASFKQAASYGNLSGLTEVLTERIFGGGSVLSGTFGKGALDSVIAKVATQPVFKAAMNVAGEGFEEAVAELFDPLWRKATFDKDAAFLTDQHLAQIAESALIGSLTSIAMGSANINTIDSLAEDIDTLTRKESKQYARGIDTTSTAKSVDDVLARMSKKLVKMEKNKRKATLAQYKLDNYFNEDGTVAEAYDGAVNTLAKRGKLPSNPDGKDIKISQNVTPDQEKVLKIAARLNKRAVVADIKNKRINAYFDPDTNTIVINSKAKNPYSAFAHELTHSIETLDKNAYREYVDFVVSEVQNNPDLQKLLADNKISMEKIEKLYKNSAKTKEGQAWVEATELIAHITETIFGNESSLNKLADKITSKTTLKKIHDWIKSIVGAMGKDKEMTPEEKSYFNMMKRAEKKFAKALEEAESGVRVSDIDRAFDENAEKAEIKRYSVADLRKKSIQKALAGELARGETVHLGYTPDFMLDFGFEQKPLSITAKHLISSTDGTKHNLPISYFETLFNNALDEPAFVIKGRENSVIFVTKDFDDNDLPVIIPIKPNAKNARINDVTVDVNMVLSVYGRENIIKFINDRAKDIIYWNKERANVITSAVRQQLSEAVTTLASETILQQIKPNVNNRYSLVGEKAIRKAAGDTYDIFTAAYQDIIKQMETAIKMRGQNVSNDEIKKKTGWHYSVDGNWKFEISDKNFKLKEDIYDEYKNNLPTTLYLEELIEHDQLFDLYPALRGLKVTLATPKDHIGLLGGFDMEKHHLYLNVEAIETNDPIGNSREIDQSMKTRKQTLQVLDEIIETKKEDYSTDWIERKTSEIQEVKIRNVALKMLDGSTHYLNAVISNGTVNKFIFSVAIEGYKGLRDALQKEYETMQVYRDAALQKAKHNDKYGRVKSTLIHEIQHYIQTVEDWTTGSNQMIAFYLLTKDIVDSAGSAMLNGDYSSHKVLAAMSEIFKNTIPSKMMQKVNMMVLGEVEARRTSERMNMSEHELKEQSDTSYENGTYLISADQVKAGLNILSMLHEIQAIMGNPFADEKNQTKTKNVVTDAYVEEYLKTHDHRYSILKDSEGTELTEGQQVYFDGTKAVDEDGNLLVLYHGTKAVFTEFQKSKAGWLGDGIYLTNDVDTINYYAKDGHKMALYADIKNPYYGSPRMDKIWEQSKGDNGIMGERISEILSEKGYDGIIREHPNGSVTVVAFNPEQVKSIDNPNPTKNLDIRYMLVGRHSEETNYSNTYKVPTLGKTLQALEKIDPKLAEIGKTFYEENYRDAWNKIAKSFGFDIETDDSQDVEFVKVMDQYEKTHGILINEIYDMMNMLDWAHKYKRKEFTLEFPAIFEKLGLVKRYPLREQLQKAKEMYNAQQDNEAYDMDAIVKETGWYLSKDNNWKYRINLNYMSFNQAVLQRLYDERKNPFVEPIKLGQLLKSKNLFKHYPHLKDIEVELIYNDEYFGMWDGHKIFLNTTLLKEYKKANLYTAQQIYDLKKAISNLSHAIEYLENQDSNKRMSQVHTDDVAMNTYLVKYVFIYYKVMSVDDPFVHEVLTDLRRDLDRNRDKYNDMKKKIDGLDDREALATLVHEIQHAIQEYEEFAQGGNQDHAMRMVRRSLEGEALEKAEIAGLDGKKLKDFVNNYIKDNIKKYNEYQAYLNLLGEREAVMAEFDALIPNLKTERNIPEFEQEALASTHEDIIEDRRFTGDLRFSKQLDSDGHELTVAQSNYFKNSQIRDEKGNLLTLYHGTPSNQFYTFKGDMFFFSKSEKFAREYGEEKSFDNGMDADIKVLKVYLNGKKLFDTRNEAMVRALIEKIDESNMSFGFGNRKYSKETWIDRIMGNHDLEPMWTREQIKNAKFGRVIGDDRDGYNNDLFVGVDKEDNVIYTDGGYLTEYVNHTTPEQRQKLLNGESVKVSLVKKRWSTEEYENLFGYAPSEFDYVTETIRPRKATQNVERLTGQDNWTYLELTYDGETQKGILDLIKQEGYDSIKIYESGEENYVAFKPNQVKLTTNTNPSVKNDMRYSIQFDNEGHQLSDQQIEFFRDSKVRDSKGQLRAVYHGTNSNFNIFDKNMQNTKEPSGDYVGKGFYFADSQSKAKRYGQNIIKAYLNLTNPLIINNQDDINKLYSAFKGKVELEEDFLKEWAEAENGIVEYMELKDKNPGEIQRLLIGLGYDGLIDNLYHQYAAFYPNQVKKTDNLTPSKSDDMRYSKRYDSKGNQITDAQEMYFMDSKIRDDKGNLLVVYHGSPNLFDTFESNPGLNSGTPTGRHYFTTDKDYAEGYAEETKVSNPNGSNLQQSQRIKTGKKGEVRSFYLNMVNPLDLTKLSDEDIKKAARFFVDNHFTDADQETRKEEYQKAVSLMMKQQGANKERWFGFYAELTFGNEFLNEYGYDGVIHHSESGKYMEYSVLNADQIKLVSNNQPKPSNDIRFSYALNEQQKNLLSKAFEIQYGKTKSGEYHVQVYNKTGALEFDITNSIDKIYEKLGDEVAKIIKQRATNVSATIYKKEISSYIGTDSKIDYSNIVQKAKDTYGTTSNIEVAAYINTDGTMLDFGDGQNGYRLLDHRDIASIMDLSGGDAMYKYIELGNIRITPEASGIELSQKPSESQIKTLRSYINHFEGQVTIDLWSSEEKTFNDLSRQSSAVYPKKTASSKIINDIIKFYDEGIKPTSASNFRYSKEIDPNDPNIIKQDSMNLNDDGKKNEAAAIQKALDNLKNKGKTDAKSTYSRGEVIKIKARYTKDKTYSKKDAEMVLNSILNEYLVFENYDGDISNKTKQQIIEELWLALNSLDEGERAKTAIDIANYIIENAILEDIYEGEQNKVDADFIAAALKYKNSIDLTSVKDEIRNTFGKDNTPFLLFGKRKGSNTISMGDIVTELAQKGIQIDGDSEAEQFVNFMKRYLKAKENIKKETKLLKSELSKQELTDLKNGVVREVLNAWDNYGKETPAKKEILKYQDIIKGLKTSLKEAKEISFAVSRLLKTIDRVSALEKYQSVEDIPLSQELVMAVKLLRQIKTWRGNLKTADQVRDIFKKYMEEVDDGTGKKIPIYELYHKLENADTFGLNPYGDLIKDIAQGKGVLTVADMNAIVMILENFIHNVKSYDKVFFENKEQSLIALSDRAIAETGELIPVKDNIFSNYKNWNMSSVWIFDRLSNFRKNGYFAQLFRELHDGVSKQARFKQQVAKHFADFFKKNRKVVDGWHDQSIDFGGVKISKGQLISLYLLSKRTQALTHLFNIDEKNGTIRISDEALAKKHLFKDADRQGEDVNITLDQVNSLQFDTVEMEFIKLAQTFFNQLSRNAKVETDVALFGVTNVAEDDYFPIRVSNDVLVKNIGDASIEFKDLFSVYNASFNKNVKRNAKNKVLIENVLDVVERHTQQMSAYYGLAIPIKNFNKVMNKKDKNGKHLFGFIYKKAPFFEKYINKLLKDIQGVRPESSTFDRILSKVRGWWARAALGLNPKVLATQFASVISAEGVGVKTRHLIKGLIKAMAGKTDYDTLYEYSPMLYDRAREGNNIDVGLLKQDVGVLGKLDALTNLTTHPISAIDKLVVGAIWNAALEQTAKDHKPNSNEHYEAAAKLVEEAVIRTQANWSPLYRPAILREHSGALQMVTMFMSEPLQIFSQLAGSIEKVKIAREINDPSMIKEASQEAKRYMVAISKNAAYLVMISMLFRWIKFGEDDDESIALQAIEELGAHFVGMLPFARDLYSLAQGFDLSNMYETGMTNIYYGIQSIWNISSGLMMNKEPYDKKNFNRDFRQLFLGISQTFGIPIKNLETYMTGIIEKFDQELIYRYRDNFKTHSYVSDLRKAIEKDDEQMAETIIDLMLEDRKIKVTDQRVQDEIGRLYTNGYNVIPKSTPKSYMDDWESIKLSKKEYANFQSTYNQSDADVSKLIVSMQYRSMSDESRAKAMRFIYDYYYNTAMEELTGDDETGRVGAMTKIVDVWKLASIVAMADAIKADTDNNGRILAGSRKQKIEAMLSTYRFNQREKDAVMAYLGYKVDTDVELIIRQYNLLGDDQTTIREIFA